MVSSAPKSFDWSNHRTSSRDMFAPKLQLCPTWSQNLPAMQRIASALFADGHPTRVFPDICPSCKKLQPILRSATRRLCSECGKSGFCNRACFVAHQSYGKCHRSHTPCHHARCGHCSSIFITYTLLCDHCWCALVSTAAGRARESVVSGLAEGFSLVTSPKQPSTPCSLAFLRNHLQLRCVH